MEVSRRQWIKSTGLTLGALACCNGCKSAPMTGRRQLVIIPESQEIELGRQAYREVLAEEKPSSNQRFVEMVNRVGQRIAASSDRSDYDWEFVCLESPTQNAFALPGGKVAIYEGILPVCQNEGGLAVVMSHEVAHALARHGGERMSQNMAIDTAKQIADKFVSNKLPQKHERLMNAYGVATEYGVLLPYSRKQESEADHIGVMLMAKSGYDPNEAPKFWRRFGSVKGAAQTSEFFSTHPSDKRRAGNLTQLMPEAMEHYQQSSSKHGLGEKLFDA